MVLGSHGTVARWKVCPSLSSATDPNTSPKTRVLRCSLFKPAEFVSSRVDGTLTGDQYAIDGRERLWLVFFVSCCCLLEIEIGMMAWIVVVSSDLNAVQKGVTRRIM